MPRHYNHFYSYGVRRKALRDANLVNVEYFVCPYNTDFFFLNKQFLISDKKTTNGVILLAK